MATFYDDPLNATPSTDQAVPRHPSPFFGNPSGVTANRAETMQREEEQRPLFDYDPGEGSDSALGPQLSPTGLGLERNGLEPYKAPETHQDWLSEPMDPLRGPTAFQRKEVSWSDGAKPSPDDDPRLKSDFLEVDFAFGRKEGATNAPIEAANVFGRRFSTLELQRDDEGRRLLDLMAERRAGTASQGGTLANFGKGWAAWSASDIPFYGWVSDLGATAGEAIDISKTMRKLQNGEKVTPHEAIQARRFMLQQELEGSRTMAYQVGQITRQMLPFMAEMYLTAKAGALIGGIIGPWGAGIGGVAGAMIGAAKWVLTAGNSAAKVGVRKVANKAMKDIVAKGAKDLAATELAQVAKTGISMYGREGFGAAFKEAFLAAKRLAPDAASAELRKEAMWKVAGNLADATVKQNRRAGMMAVRSLLGADNRIVVSSGAMKAGEDFLLKQAGVASADDVAKLSVRQYNRLLRQGLDNMGGFKSETWKKFRSGLSDGVVKGLNGEDVGGKFVRSAMQETTGQYINPKFAKEATQVVLDDAMRTLELRVGNGFLSSPERFARYLGDHVVRGLVQSEHAMIQGASPTLAHSGMSSFFRSSDALKEGLGRVFVEAPVTAAVQLGLSQTVTAPLFAMASGHGADEAVFKGQLGMQAAALVRGDRDAMDSARMCAVGSMFAEYMSESAGRGLGLMAGGLAGTVSMKTVPQITKGAGAAKDFLVHNQFTRKAGSVLAKAVDAVYGTGDLQKVGTDKLVGLATGAIAKWTKNGSRKVAESDVRNALTTMSFKGTSQAFRQIMEEAGVKSASALRARVVRETQELGRFGVLRACFGAELLRRGYSPDAIVRKFRQFGYGGVIEEMGEERVGDFVRGMMGWDDSASNEEIGERLKNAFSGFADPKQLMTEMIGFAIPGAVRSFTMASQKWLMNGGLQTVREADRRLSNLVRTASSPRVLHEAGSEEQVAAEERRRADLDAKRDEALGTSDSNRAALEANASAAYAGLGELRSRLEGEKASNLDEEGKPTGPTAEQQQAENDLAPVFAAQSELDMKRRLAEFGDSFMGCATPEELEKRLAAAHAEEVLGADGVQAVRREWRKGPDHAFASDHEIEASLAEYEKARQAPVDVAAPLPKSAAEAAETIYMSSPILGRDASQTSEQEEKARRGSDYSDVTVAEDVLDSGVEDLMEVSRAKGRAAYFAGEKGGLGRRFLTRFVGMMGAMGTGELSLATANPAEFISNDNGTDRQLGREGLLAYSASLIAGYNRIRDTVDAKVREKLDAALGDGTFLPALRDMNIDVPTLEAMEEAGADKFREAATDVMRKYLASCGTMVMTREAADRAALEVVAARHRDGNEYAVSETETVKSYTDPRFAAAWKGEVEAAHKEVVDELVRVATSAMGFNTHPTLGSDRVALSVDVGRAISAGTKEEVLAALLRSDALRGVASVANVSGHAELDREFLYSTATTMQADVGSMLDIDVDSPRRLTEAEMAAVADICPLDVTKSDEDNQKAVRNVVRYLRLAAEGAGLEYEDASEAGGRRAYVRRSGSRFVARIVGTDGTATELPFASMKEARDELARREFSMREKKLVVATVRDIVSSDATSLLMLRYGNDQEAVRAAYLKAMGVSSDEESLVREASLPPFIRKREVSRNGERRLEFAYRPDQSAEAAREFRRELELAREGQAYGSDASMYLRGQDATPEQRAERMRLALDAAANMYGASEGGSSTEGYETVAGKMLEQAGVRRNVNPVMKTNLGSIGVSSDAWVMPFRAVRTGDAIVLTPDYASEGHAEAFLRMGMRGAIDSYLQANDPDLPTKYQIFADAYRAFREAAEEVSAELRDREPEKAQRVMDAFDTACRATLDGVSADSIAAIASASVFFSCERSLRGRGNGFLSSPELARIADRFRGKEIFPVFVSALDEAAGGIGLFHKTADAKGNPLGSASGLSRFLEVFADDAEAVRNGRSSAMFSSDRDGKVAAPFLPRLALRKGMKADALNAGAPCVDVRADARDTAFDGDVRGGYMVRLAGACHSFATDYFEVAGGTRSVLSASEVYRMMRRSDAKGGTAKASVEEGSKEGLFQGARPGVDAALDKVLSPELVSGITEETAREFGNDLRMMADSVGASKGRDEARFRSEVEAYLLDQAVPEEIVRDIVSAFDEAVVVETAKADRPEEDAQASKDREQERDDEAMAGEGLSNENVWAVRREAMFADSNDVAAISRVVRWVFRASGGSIAHTLQEFRNEVFRDGALSDAELLKAEEEAKARGVPVSGDFRRDVGSFLDALNPCADVAKLHEAYARSPWYAKVVNGRRERPDQTWQRVDRILDNVIRAFTLNRRYDMAIVMATLRNVPAKDGRRVKFLEMLSHLTPCEADYVQLSKEGFSLERMESVSESSLAPVTVQATYSSLLHSPLMGDAVRSGDKGRIADALAATLARIRLASDPAYSLVKTVPGNSLGEVREQGWPERRLSKSQTAPVFCGDTAQEASDLYAKLTDRTGTTDFAAFCEALDRVTEIVKERAAKCADALDGLLGKGSHLARVFRSAETFGAMRRRAAESYDSKDRNDVDLLLRLCNYFTACRGVTNKNQGQWQTWMTSQALADAFEEPFEAVAARYGIGPRSFSGTLPKEEELAARFRKAIGDRITDSFDRNLRSFFRDLAVSKVRLGTHFDDGLTHAAAVRKHGAEFKPGSLLQRPVLASLVDAYVAAGAQSSRKLGGYSTSLTQLAKERGVTTLPCMLPALARACASDLFKVGGAAKELQDNGMLWADGTRPIVSVVGAKDYNGSLFDKAALAGILRRAIIREVTSGKHLDRYVFPLFRGDKPSCFALQVPARIVNVWVEEAGKSADALAAFRKAAGLKEGKPIPSDVEVPAEAKLAANLPQLVLDTLTTLRESLSSVTEVVNAPGGAKDAAEYAGKTGGVNTLRVPGAKFHFGNPFSNQDYRGVTRKVATIKEAVERYESWLRGTSDQDLEPERRQFIIDAISSGKLDGRKLVYYTDKVDHGDYDGTGTITKYDPETAPNHAHILAKLVNERRKASRPDPAEAFYGAAEALMWNATGHVQLDAKRVQVTMSVGVPISLFGANEDGTVENDAGAYFVSTFSGRTGTQYTGSYFIHGCAADRVSELNEGDRSISQKLHVLGLQGSVNLKKGQGFAFGLGCDEADNDEHLTLASYREQQRVLRREAEDILSSRLPKAELAPGMEGILDPVPEDAKETMEKDAYEALVAAHRDAVAELDAFSARATLFSDDNETNKAGVFGGRFGFAADELDEIVVSVERTPPKPEGEAAAKPKKAKGRKAKKEAEPEKVVRSVQVMKKVDGKWTLGDDVRNWNIDIADETKNGQVPIALCLAAACASLEDSISSGDLAKMASKFHLADGRIVEGTLADVLPKGDRLSFRWDEKAKVPRMTYFTRSMIAQIVANNANSSRPSDHHTFPTNTTRDEEILEELISSWELSMGRIRPAADSGWFASAHVGYSALQLAQLGHVGADGKSVVGNALLSDAKLAGQLKDRPDDNGVADQISDKIGALYRKQVLPNFNGTHGVMSPGNCNGHVLLDECRFDHTAALDWAPGTTDYDRDLLRPAPVYGSAEREFFGMDRGYASGLVNTTEKSFRYGWHMDEAAFDRNVDPLFDGAQLADRIGEFEAVIREAGNVPKGKGAKGRRQADAYVSTTARRAALVEACVTAARDWTPDPTAKGKQKNPYREALLASFRDYTGNFASEGWNAATVSFDDLFLTNGLFDVNALDFLKFRTSSDPEAGATMYLGGSFFAAHRSPSGNIEAYSGVARASAPVSSSKRGKGRPGRESIYTLDGITMNTQGSDTDGDSAGAQVRKGGRNAFGHDTLSWLTTDVRNSMRDDGVIDADRLWDAISRRGWTERKGEVDVVKDDVMDTVSRLLFDAQVENYRRMPVVHQGFLGSRNEKGEVVENKAMFDEIIAERRKRGANDRATSGLGDDVILGYEIADYYRRHPMSDGRALYDYGFAGRQPVGTNAVYEEPVTERTRTKVLEGLSKNVPESVRALVVDGTPMNKVLKNAVNLISGKGDTAIEDPTKAAATADAVSDSADGRGKSVFHQSRFLRAFAYKFGFSDMDLVDYQTGYSPVVDFTSHADGVSNNLFDTAKEMFATRAGWTKAMLPYFLGQCAYRAFRKFAADKRNFRIDSAFFLAESLNFLCSVMKKGADGKAEYRKDTVLGRVAYLTDAVDGRVRLVTQAVAAGILPLAEDETEIPDRYLKMPADKIVSKFAYESGLAESEEVFRTSHPAPGTYGAMRWHELSPEAQMVIVASRMTRANGEKFAEYKAWRERVKKLRTAAAETSAKPVSAAQQAKLQEIKDRIAHENANAPENPFLKEGDRLEQTWVAVAEDVLAPVKAYGERVDYVVRSGWDAAKFRRSQPRIDEATERFISRDERGRTMETGPAALQAAVAVTMNDAMAGKVEGSDKYDAVLEDTLRAAAREGELPAGLRDHRGKLTPLGKILFREPRRPDPKDHKLHYRRNPDGMARGSDLRENQDRMVHFLAIVAGERSADIWRYVDSFGTTETGFSEDDGEFVNSTTAFVNGFTGHVRYASQYFASGLYREDLAKMGVKFGAGHRELERIMSSLLITGNGEIGCAAGFGSADTKALQDTFRKMLSSDSLIPVGDELSVPANVFARSLMLYAGITRPYGATVDYHGKSSLPAVFPEDAVRHLESVRQAVVNDPTLNLLTAVKPVEVKTGARTKVKTYDIVRARQAIADVAGNGRVWKIAKEWANTPQALFLKAVAEGSVGPAMKSLDSVSTPEGDKFRVRKAKAAKAENRYGEPMTETATDFGRAQKGKFLTRHGEFAKPYVDKKTQKISFRDRRGRALGGYCDTLEEAYNALLALRIERMSADPLRLREADRFYEDNGRGEVNFRDSARQGDLKRILRDAVSHSRPMWDALAGSLDSPVMHRDPNVTRALNDVLSEMKSGRLEYAGPAVGEDAKPAVAAGSAAPRGRGNGVTRIDFLDRIGEIFPEGNFTRAEAESVPKAIAAAFEAVYGQDRVETSVVVRDGKPTNLVKVVRDTGKGKVTTFFSTGDALGWNSSDFDFADSALSTINEVRRANGLRELNRIDLHNMSGFNLHTLALMGRASGNTMGSSHKATADFAPFMSGLVRLDHRADFATLFHEYYHQMVGCMELANLVDRDLLARVKAQYPNEEDAANAYAAFLTGASVGRGTAMLKSFGTDDPGVAEAFEQMRRASAMLAAISYDGDDDGVPAFARLVMSPDTRFADADEAKLKKAEDEFLGRKGDFAIPYSMTVEDQLKVVDLWNSAFVELTERAEPDVSAAAAAAFAIFEKPSVRSLEEGGEAEEEVGTASDVPETEPSKPEPGVDTVTGFLKAAVARFKNQQAASELKADLEGYKATEVSSGYLAASELGHLVFNVRNLLLQVAAMHNLPVHDLETGELTELGKRLLTDENAALLAMRLLNDSTFERNALRDETNRQSYATHASATYAAARALEGIAPRSYGTRAKFLAVKASDMFARVADRLSARADRAASEAEAEPYRKQAAVLYETARLVVSYAGAITRGRDLHYLISRKTNRGNPIGLLSAILSGGASFRENRGWGNRGNDLPAGENVSLGANGVRRYAPGSSGLALTQEVMDDPLVALAFEYASQALYGAVEARSFNEQVNGFTKGEDEKRAMRRKMKVAQSGTGSQKTGRLTEEGKAQVVSNLVEGMGEADPALTQDAPAYAEPEEWFQKVDTRTTTPDWILANPGRWLLSDMQSSLQGVGMREMMTDHSIRAVTESAYRLSADFSMFFGLDTCVGDGVRQISYDVSKLGRNAKGDFAIDDDYAHSVTNFSATRGYLFGIFNLGEKREKRPLGSEDLRDLDFFAGQLVRSICGRDRNWVSGVRVRDLTVQPEAVERLDSDDWATLMSPAAVLARFAKRRNVRFGDTDVTGEFTRLDAMLVRAMEDMPMTALKGSSADRGSFEGITSVNDRALDGGYYRKLVEGLRDGLAKARATLAEKSVRKTVADGFFSWEEGEASEFDDEDASWFADEEGEAGDPAPASEKKADYSALSTALAKELAAHGLAVRGKKGDVYLSLKVADCVELWDRCTAKSILKESGRPEKLLNLYYWANRFGKELAKINDAAAASRYLSNGIGSNISLAGKRFFWWHGGSGSHSRDVSRFRAAADLFRGMRESGEERLARVQNEVFGNIERLSQADLRKPAFVAGGTFNVPMQQVMFLARALGLKDGQKKFDVNAFANDAANGRFETARASIPRNATVLDVTMLVNRLASERNFASVLRAGDMPVAERQALLDMRTVCDRIAERLKNDVPGTVAAMSDESQFRYGTGELGSSMTAPEAMISMCRELTTAERFRGCLAQALVAVSSDGLPAYVVSPTPQMVEASGMPDEYWGALARHVVETAGTRLKSVLKYDEAFSGVENMRRIYDALSKSADAKQYTPLDVGKANAQYMFDGILCRKSDLDIAGNSDPLAAAQGGEAACQMRQLLAVLNAPTSNAAWRVLDTVSSWTKIASVGFSAFFQIATVFESPTAAVGFWHTVLGGKKLTSDLARRIGKAMKRSGGTGAFQADAAFLSDLVRFVNSDDPMLTEARELCDLMGMPLDLNVPYNPDSNDSNPVLGNAGTVQRQCKAIAAVADRYLGAKAAKGVRKSLDFLYKHPTDYTFNVVLNGVKMAVVMQTMRRLRAECLAGKRPFDPVRELRRYATYINAEIGGIDPARYAWATPQMRRALSCAMFSWQWTLGAWEAGGGGAISDLLFGGHSSTPESRQWAFVRWLRMLGIVKFGVPVVLQAACKALATALSWVLPPDPDDEKDRELDQEIEDMPWLCIFNESKAGALAFDVTPLLKLANRIPGVAALKRADIPVISAMVPAYVGGGRNTTARRRYYMHFGKQSDEFFRWFEAPFSQAVAKTSIPLQKVLEGVFGRLQPQGYSKAFADKSLAERWLNFDLTDPDQSALANLVWSMTSFSYQSVKSNPDAGWFAAVGPMRMGQSKRSTRLRIVERLKEIAEDAGSNDPWTYGRNRRKLNLLCTDILREAQLNGVDAADIMTSAIGDVAKGEYLKLMDALPKDIRTNEFDVPQLREAVRGLTQVNRRVSDILNSVVEKYKAAGTDVKKSPKFMQAVRGLVKATQDSPFAFTDAQAEEALAAFLSQPERQLRSTQMASKGGEAFANFLATDDVPDTLFGVKVVTSDYTEEDLMFFEEHPEAGGFYDLEDGTDDGGPGEPPVPPTGGGLKNGPTLRSAPSGAGFSAAFESKPVTVVKNGKRYMKPTKDARGKYDIAGYRRYWSESKKAMVAHSNGGLLPEKAFTEGKRRTDEYVDATTNAVYKRYGVDAATLDEGVSTASRDIVFATGGNDLKDSSPKLLGIVDRLRSTGMKPNDAYGIALALEQDSYGDRNYRRQAARGGAVIDALSRSGDPTARRFAEAYAKGWSADVAETDAARTEDAFGTNWARHAAGMREASKVADELGLDYSANVDK